MNHVNALIRLIDRGLKAQLMLNDGSMIRQFQPHDILARGGVDGVVVVRGMVEAGLPASEFRVVPLCDVGGVFGERPSETFGVAPGFYERNPIPRGWTKVHARAGEAAL